MAISKHDLEKMNDLVEKGATIADIANKFKKYDYWEIYWEVEDYTLLGKKRRITNRLNKLQKNLKKEDQQELVKAVKELINEIYNTSKKNGKKLIDIGKILSK